MRKYLPVAISLILFSIVALLWNVIKLPYDTNNLIFGEYYYKKLNPQNDLIRFILITVIPCLVYLISYLKIDNFTFSLNKNKSDFFLKNVLNKTEDNPLNNYYYFFIILITLEFCTLNFQQFSSIDLFHDSVFLTPPFNYLSNGETFKSTLYDYGFTGNNLGLIFNYFFGFYTLGAINFIKLILIYITKLVLILIAKKISSYLQYDIFYKKLFFISFTFAILCLPSYYDFTSYFSPRSALYLLFIFVLCSALCDGKFKELKFFLIGSFSLVSLLWWFDVGFYTNFLLILSSIYLIFFDKKKLFFLLLGFSLIWIIFLIATPSYEIQAFFYNIQFIINTTDYLIGIEYQKPFSENSARWTKALLIIYFCSIILVNLNFSKKINLNKNLKIFLNFYFISGILIFKSALTRSDASHLKYASGIYTTIFIFIILFYIFNYFKKKQVINNYLSNFKESVKEKITIIFLLTLTVFFFTGIINSKNNVSLSNKFINIINLKSNIINLINMEDRDYLEEKNLLVMEKYKDLAKNDKCLQYFSDDNFFPYFLKKPTCTKFYLANQILKGFSEQDFLLDFKNSSPEIILFESPTKILTKYENFPNVIKYINKNYKFYENYKGYIFYKKIKNND